MRKLKTRMASDVFQTNKMELKSMEIVKVMTVFVVVVFISKSLTSKTKLPFSPANTSANAETKVTD